MPFPPADDATIAPRLRRAVLAARDADIPGLARFEATQLGPSPTEEPDHDAVTDLVHELGLDYQAGHRVWDIDDDPQRAATRFLDAVLAMDALPLGSPTAIAYAGGWVAHQDPADPAGLRHLVQTIPPEVAPLVLSLLPPPARHAHACYLAERDPGALPLVTEGWLSRPDVGVALGRSGLVSTLGDGDRARDHVRVVVPLHGTRAVGGDDELANLQGMLAAPDALVTVHHAVTYGQLRGSLPRDVEYGDAAHRVRGYLGLLAEEMAEATYPAGSGATDAPPPVRENSLVLVDGERIGTGPMVRSAVATALRRRMWTPDVVCVADVDDRSRAWARESWGVPEETPLAYVSGGGRLPHVATENLRELARAQASGRQPGGGPPYRSPGPSGPGWPTTRRRGPGSPRQ